MSGIHLPPTHEEQQQAPSKLLAGTSFCTHQSPVKSGSKNQPHRKAFSRLVAFCAAKDRTLWHTTSADPLGEAEDIKAQQQQ